MPAQMMARETKLIEVTVPKQVPKEENTEVDPMTMLPKVLGAIDPVSLGRANPQHGMHHHTGLPKEDRCVEVLHLG